MRKSLFVFLLFVTVKLFPQQIQQPPEPPQTTNKSVQIQQPAQQNISTVDMKNKIKAEKFENMKINGIVLASVGGAALVGGIVALSIGLYNQNAAAANPSNSANQSATPFYISSQVATGLILGFFGGSAITGGIIMASIGNQKLKKYATASRLSVFVAPTAFRIAYKF
jgi:hypothetical protein